MPLATQSFTALLEAVGLKHYEVDEQKDAVSLNIQGDQVAMGMHIVVGRSKDGEPWYFRFISYPLDLEPRSLGLAKPDVLEWVNKKNSDLIFGRFYYEETSDVLAFEVSMPASDGIKPQDFLDMLHVAAFSVDTASQELRALLPLS
jgi:hypothetical protein